MNTQIVKETAATINAADLTIDIESLAGLKPRFECLPSGVFWVNIKTDKQGEPVEERILVTA
ncbi:hypothetical protein [Neisseria iguanae]|uniref:Uncharacterized protein n=1 Tax=Neisseria iguanae TaxID=90242 RepID=A0A2P7U361_9NEIS|nr:hypothetical protein [Neisseria iguanae]PSJ81432.1 hypothetical protein C7N83_00625 [Neisseria iguanae]